MAGMTEGVDFPRLEFIWPTCSSCSGAGCDLCLNTGTETEDLGHGVYVRRCFEHEEGKQPFLTSLAYKHPGCLSNEWHHIHFGKYGWTLESTDPLTVNPSLLCRLCGHHGFIRGGKWLQS